MPADFEDRIDDNEAASVSIGSLVGREIKGLPRSKEVARNTQAPSGAGCDSRERLREVSKPH